MTIEKGSGHLGKVVNKNSGLSVNMNQQFLWYWASDGHNTNSSQVCSCYCIVSILLCVVVDIKRLCVPSKFIQ